MTFFKRADESVEWLRGVDFFDGFSDRELHNVIALSSEVEAVEGTVLIDQGDPGTHCFVVVQGQLAVYIAGEYVTSVSAGSMVGEMALIDHGPRTATVVAEQDSKLLRFNAPQFRKLLDETPKASERVMALLYRRVAQRP